MADRRKLLCLLLALVCFMLALFGVTVGPSFNLVTAGLCFFTLAHLV